MASTSATSSPSQIHQNVVPSEVGWEFVPQYYTFVNQQPNRLHCFYTKASTFVHGTEGENVTPCNGQQVTHYSILCFTRSHIVLRKSITRSLPLVSTIAKSISTLSTLSLVQMTVSSFKSLARWQIKVLPGANSSRPSSLPSSLTATLSSMTSSAS